MTQTHLEGMEPASIPDLDDAVERWHRAESARHKAILARTTHADTITGLMRQHAITSYTSNGWVCQLTSKDIVHVKPGKPDTDADEETEQKRD